MNQEMQEHTKQALQKGVRLDGRKCDEFRNITIETGFISTAEGSARVKFGDAEVIAGVKLALEKPYEDTPDSGVLMVNSELLPLSNPDFESGPPSIDSIETARVIDRGVRESKAIDTKKLCVSAGEKVWSIAIDVVPVNYDGNLIDMGGLAALAALKNARFPKVKEDGTIDYHARTDQKIELSKQPIPVTVYKIGEILLIDPTDEESKTAEARLTVTVLDDNKLCALQKGGDSPLSAKDVEKMVDLAFAKAAEIKKKLAEVN